jgi:hypothetical protein
MAGLGITIKVTGGDKEIGLGDRISLPVQVCEFRITGKVDEVSRGAGQ